MGGGTRLDRREAMLIMDTHTLVWLRYGDSRLGNDARRESELAWRNNDAAVSAFTFWEVAMLRTKDRVDSPEDVAAWRRELLGQGLIEIPVDGDIGIRANALAGFHADPADRIIVATALSGHRLVTADERILGWSGSLDRLDARR